MIAGIPVTAPLWRGASQEALSSIIECLSTASYHYADDAAREWRYGHEAVRLAAARVNELGLGFSAIERLYKHSPQLVSFEQFIDAILKEARL